MQFMTWMTRAALVGGLLTGAVAPAMAQDDDLTRRVREEVMKELRPEFERLEAAQRERLWKQFEKLVNEKVAERVAEARAQAERERVRPAPRSPQGGKPSMGISVSPTTAGVNALLDLGETGGLSVRRVDEGGPADTAGLQVGDVITKIGGERIGSLDALREHLAGRRGGDSDRIEFLRQGKVRTVEFVYGGNAGGATPPSAADGDSAAKVRRFLTGLNPATLAQIERLLDSVQDPTDRAEMLRLAERKLAEGFEGASADDLHELRRALTMGTRKYLSAIKAAVRDPKSRAEALEQLLNGMLKKGGRSEKSVERLLDDILGEGGKKPGKTAKPADGDAPEIDPEKFQQELLRVKERIERDGFPQDDAEVTEFVDTILKNVGLTRPQVRNLITSMGGPEQAKGIVRMQIQQLDITLTEDDLDRVLKAIMDDGKQSAGGGDGGERAKPGKIGCRLKPEARGAKVQSVSEDSPAAKAGLRPGDLLLTFGGRDVTDLSTIKGVLAAKRAGDTIALVVERNGATTRLTMTLEAQK